MRFPFLALGDMWYSVQSRYGWGFTVHDSWFRINTQWLAKVRSWVQRGFPTPRTSNTRCILVDHCRRLGPTTISCLCQPCRLRDVAPTGVPRSSLGLQEMQGWTENFFNLRDRLRYPSSKNNPARSNWNISFTFYKKCRAKQSNSTRM